MCAALHAPVEHEYDVLDVHAAGDTGTQLVPSAVPVPEQAPAEHWLWLLTHCPLSHCASAVQMQAVRAELHSPTAHAHTVPATELIF